MARRRVVRFVIAALIGSAFGTGAAIGHSGNYYAKRVSPDRGNIAVYFDRTTPTGAFRDRFRTAFNEWERFQTKVSGP